MKEKFFKSGCKMNAKIAVGLYMLCTVCAHAAEITWGSPVAISGASDVLANGVVHAAVNLGGINTVTVNGIRFSADDDFVVDGRSHPVPSTVNDPFIPTPEYGELLNTAKVYSSLITLSDLTIGRTYTAQLWASDPRHGPSKDDRKVEFISERSSVLLETSYNDAGGYGYWVTGTFVADETSQTVQVEGYKLGAAPSGARVVNAILLLDTTEEPLSVG